MSERSSTKPGKKQGRPFKHSRKYILEVVVPQFLELSKQGYFIEAIAGKLEITKETLYEWFELYPELADAKKQGASLRQKFFYELGMSGTMGKLGKNFNPTMFIWMSKNCAGWRDKDTLQNQEVKINRSDIVFRTSWGGNEEPSDES